MKRSTGRMTYGEECIGNVHAHKYRITDQSQVDQITPPNVRDVLEIDRYDATVMRHTRLAKV